MSFQRSHFSEQTHSWTQCEVQALPDAAAETLARAIADDIVRQRTLGIPALHTSWSAALSGTPLDAEAARLLPIFLEPGFGIPSSPKTDTLAQATVAEHLWHVAMNDVRAQRAIVLVTKPKFHTTAPGGDGLVVFGQQQLFFELWEIKKYKGTTPSKAVNRACKQLAANAARYLAEHSDIAQARTDLDQTTKSFIARLVPMWLDGDTSARAGVCVASSVATDGTFTALANHFNHLRGTLPRAGLIFVVGDLPAFAQRVRELVWTGQ